MQKPLLNQLAPGFSLESTDDQTISPWDYKGKKGLVMLFFDPRDSRDLAVLSEIRRRYREITDASAEVLAIASGPKVELMECAEGMDLPFPLLSDADNDARSRYGVSATSVFVTDRFGELKMDLEVPEDLDAALDAVISTLELADLECPECSVAVWPEE